MERCDNTLETTGGGTEIYVIEICFIEIHLIRNNSDREESETSLVEKLNEKQVKPEGLLDP